MAQMCVGIDLSPLGYGNRVRGVGIYAENLLTALAEIDRTTQYLILITKPVQGIHWLSRLPDNFRQVILPSPKLGRASALISHQVVVPIQARRLGLDVLHCIDMPRNPSHPGIPWWQTVATMVTVHDLTPLVMGSEMLTHVRYRLFYRFMLQACRRAAHLIADSNNTALDIVRYGLAPEMSVTVVPLAVPRFTDEAGTLSEGLANILSRPYILHVGGADPSKNQAAVLKAFARLCRDPCFNHRLVLLGTHHLGDEIAVGLEPRAADRIIRLSSLSRVEVRRLYEGCDVFVFPSYYEGFGLPVLEAMHCGVPVVASDTSSVPEVAGDAAILINPDDYAGFAEAVRRLLADSGLREHHIEAGYQQVQRFTWPRTAQMTRGIYERVTAGL